jgi:hypothetical protein
MATTSEILGTVLMSELATIRTGSLWKMFSLEESGHLPKPDEEGATGDFDNKGAVFVPRGLIFQDSDEDRIDDDFARPFSSVFSFRQCVREAMRYDNATLFSDRGLISGVNLNNTFHSRLASSILSDKVLARRRSRRMGGTSPDRITSGDISKSNCPLYISPPYGARTKLSSCLSVCLTENHLYYAKAVRELQLRKESSGIFWDDLSSAIDPVQDSSGTVLAQPHVVVCHNTRYKSDILTGITRILGIGKFGEFATFTLEEATNSLLEDLPADNGSYSEEDYFARYCDHSIVGVLRIYSPTTPGSRSQKGLTASLVLPEKDLGISVKRIEAESRGRYPLRYN